MSIDPSKYPGLDPSVIGVFDTYERRISDLEQTIAALRERNAELEHKLAHLGVCSVCFTSSWEPTPDGQRCGYCWLHEQADRALSELAEARKALDSIAPQGGRE